VYLYGSLIKSYVGSGRPLSDRPSSDDQSNAISTFTAREARKKMPLYIIGNSGVFTGKGGVPAIAPSSERQILFGVGGSNEPPVKTVLGGRSDNFNGPVVRPPPLWLPGREEGNNE
jgi:hypothetical protein